MQLLSLCIKRSACLFVSTGTESEHFLGTQWEFIPTVSYPAAKRKLYLLWQASRRGSAKLQNKQLKNKIYLQSTELFPHTQIAFHFSFLLSSLSCSLAVQRYGQNLTAATFRVCLEPACLQEITEALGAGGKEAGSRTRRRLRSRKERLDVPWTPGIGCFFPELGIWSVKSCQNHVVIITEGQDMLGGGRGRGQKMDHEIIF